VSHPFLVPFDLNPEASTPVTPRFPRWEKSFVSGTASTLFQVTHSVSTENPNVLFSLTRFLDHAEGPPGHVHGGATAGILDEVMGILVWHLGYPSLTQSIQVHYRKAIPLHLNCTILTRIEAIREKTIEAHSTLYDEAQVAYVTAQGLFHRLNEDQLERFKKKAQSQERP
jgi:acyl-coenzyme A thioesterase PaaI-like protein